MVAFFSGVPFWVEHLASIGPSATGAGRARRGTA
jgi:hypothetical protein